MADKEPGRIREWPVAGFFHGRIRVEFRLCCDLGWDMEKLHSPVTRHHPPNHHAHENQGHQKRIQEGTDQNGQGKEAREAGKEKKQVSGHGRMGSGEVRGLPGKNL
jgi:hypothetical protein